MTSPSPSTPELLPVIQADRDAAAELIEAYWPHDEAMVYRARPLPERFWEKVERLSTAECWPWAGSRTKNGYGLLGTRRATHIALELAGRPQVPGQIALHGCDNPICVNPAHLRWGTDQDNAADCVSRKRHHASRRTHCVHGHSLDGDNLLIRRNGQRSCRACQRRRMLEHRERSALPQSHKGE